MKLMPNWKSHFAKPSATHRPDQGSSAAGTVSVTVPPLATVTRQGQPPAQAGATVTEPGATTEVTAQRASGRTKPLPPQCVTDTSWHEKYLELLEETGGQKMVAIKGCGVTRKTLAAHRNADPEFAAAEKLALKEASDVCEDEARRRAINGVKSTVTTVMKDGSVRTYEDTKYSDTILLRLLEKNETGSWRQKQQIEHSGGMSFKTEAERKAALEKARAIRDGKPVPVEAIHGRS